MRESLADLWSAAKAHLKWLEQGDRARIMRLAYIRDVGMGTVYCYTVPIICMIIDNIIGDNQLFYLCII